MNAIESVPGITEIIGKNIWYHGSPARLTSIRSGSTITGNKTLAMAFSHKPVKVLIEVTENEETGIKTVVLKQDGSRRGYLYRVIVDDPEVDTREDPESVMFPGDEVLTTRELRVELLEEIALRSEYIFDINC
ncbi:MAG: hypothetical protein KAR40_04415 [Candidatus Sabulitectum sp.]|nr:hypothetical protein [Candidatus Sabulitectum sp.]